MSMTPIATPPGMSAVDAMKAANAASTYGKTDTKAKAWKASQDFEQVFLNNMFQHMFSGLEGDGPLGGKGAGGVWRSFLIDKYAENFTKSGGVGIAKQVYSTLLAQQETK